MTRQQEHDAAPPFTHTILARAQTHMCTGWAATRIRQVGIVMTTHVCLHSLSLISIEEDLRLLVGFNLSDV